MNSSSARQNERPAGGLTASANDRSRKRLPQAIAAFLLASGFLHAAEPVVEHVITCQPSFIRRGAAVHVRLVDSTNRFEAMWYNSDFFLRRFSLDTNQIYTFTVLEGLDKPPPGPRIARVYQGTERIYDAGYCVVHQRRMELVPSPSRMAFMGRPGSHRLPTRRRSRTVDGLFPAAALLSRTNRRPSWNSSVTSATRPSNGGRRNKVRWIRSNSGVRRRVFRPAWTNSRTC